MNLVDSCGWLEYFGDGPNAVFFAAPLRKTAKILVPTICLYEVFKKVLSERDEDSALQAIAVMRQGLVVPLDSTISMGAAKISHVDGLPMAAAIILATARIDLDELAGPLGDMLIPLNSQVLQGDVPGQIDEWVSLQPKNSAADSAAGEVVVLLM